MCNVEFEKEREWTDRNEGAVEIQILCHYCYEENLAQSVVARMEKRDDAWELMLTDAVSDLRQKNDNIENNFGLSRHQRWDWDQDAGELTFSNDGIPAVRSSIQFVGSVSTVSDTWLWSWANQSIETSLYDRVLMVRDFGEEQDFANLTVPKWHAEEVDGWEMAAVAAKVTGAQGVYRTPDDGGFTFLLLFNLETVQ